MNPTQTPPPPKSEKPSKPPKFQIQIDRVHYEVHQSEMTGTELRSIPSPPIGPERDLFEVIPGEPDHKVLDDEKIVIRNGKRFFTAPGRINPGLFG